MGNYDNPTNDEGDEIGKIHILNDFSEEELKGIMEMFKTDSVFLSDKAKYDKTAAQNITMNVSISAKAS